MQVAVIGLGKLGLPFALFLASRGQQVFCYDKNLKILNQIKKKKSPYIEPLVDNYLKKIFKKYHNTKKSNKYCKIFKNNSYSFTNT
jgi:UDP-N-acetyl-D-mannosaminuronate dehydrogenase